MLLVGKPVTRVVVQSVCVDHCTMYEMPEFTDLAEREAS